MPTRKRKLRELANVGKKENQRKLSFEPQQTRNREETSTLDAENNQELPNVDAERNEELSTVGVESRDELSNFNVEIPGMLLEVEISSNEADISNELPTVNVDSGDELLDFAAGENADLPPEGMPNVGDEILHEYDLGDILSEEKNSTREEKYLYFTKRYVPKENDDLLKKTITPGTANHYTLTSRKEWLSDKKRPWHVYSRKLSGGLCKACVLFDEAEQNWGIFVNWPFQHIKNSEKIKLHEEKIYHQKAMEAANHFVQLYENPGTNIGFTKQKDKNYRTNLHIIRRIVEAVMLCAEQGLALRGHRDHLKNESEEPCCERSFGRGNFIAIICKN